MPALPCGAHQNQKRHCESLDHTRRGGVGGLVAFVPFHSISVLCCVSSLRSLHLPSFHFVSFCIRHSALHFVSFRSAFDTSLCSAFGTSLRSAFGTSLRSAFDTSLRSFVVLHSWAAARVRFLSSSRSSSSARAARYHSSGASSLSCLSALSCCVRVEST
ncbi:hypothetical protein DENSPDRAFT_701012 [Dentipellis sp. KUC8613]|nr:hypothetical protein DENSPDRAFT_701012 [Dentipellis sp. KUC8613]